jgi:hypothetical protein
MPAALSDRVENNSLFVAKRDTKRMAKRKREAKRMAKRKKRGLRGKEG